MPFLLGVVGGSESRAYNQTSEDDEDSGDSP